MPGLTAPPEQHDAYLVFFLLKWVNDQ